MRKLPIHRYSALTDYSCGAALGAALSLTVVGFANVVTAIFTGEVQLFDWRIYGIGNNASVSLCLLIVWRIRYEERELDRLIQQLREKQDELQTVLDDSSWDKWND